MTKVCHRNKGVSSKYLPNLGVELGHARRLGAGRASALLRPRGVPLSRTRRAVCVCPPRGGSWGAGFRLGATWRERAASFLLARCASQRVTAHWP